MFDSSCRFFFHYLNPGTILQDECIDSMFNFPLWCALQEQFTPRLYWRRIDPHSTTTTAASFELGVKSSAAAENGRAV